VLWPWGTLGKQHARRELGAGTTDYGRSGGVRMGVGGHVEGTQNWRRDTRGTGKGARWGSAFTEPSDGSGIHRTSRRQRSRILVLSTDACRFFNANVFELGIASHNGTTRCQESLLHVLASLLTHIVGSLGCRN
jgi:hypothetical protein